MSDDYIFQTSFKHGPKNDRGEPTEMTNVRGKTEAEFRANIRAINGLAADIYLASETLRADTVGVHAVSTTQQNPTPQAANTQPTQVPQQPSGGTQLAPPDQCAHGTRNRVNGEKNGKPWVGDFCALPKGSQGSCAPIFHDIN